MYDRLIWKMYTHICAIYTAINHISSNNVQYFIYITKQIWLPYCSCIVYCTANVMYILTHINAHITPKKLVSDPKGTEVFR